MSKSKSANKATKPSKDSLTKVKDAAVTKPAQTVKSKSKDIAKEVAKKEGKKNKKKEPTPEPSDSESESASSESEAEEKPVKAANGTKPAIDASASDSDSSESSEDETPATNSKAQVNDTSDDSSDDSDESESDSGSEADLSKDSDSSDESSEDERPAKQEAKKEVKQIAKEEADSGSDSSDSESEVEEPKTNKRKVEADAEPVAKKSKTENASGNLFVGNLSWNVDDAWLKEIFEEFGEVTRAQLMTDRATGRSKGFGYVEFVNADDAAKAHAAKNGTEVDGRAMNVDLANSRPSGQDKTENRRKSYGDAVSEPSDTLFLGNLSFEVGQEEVTDAFSPHGTVMGIRLPTDRETGQPKGFGYVTFSSAEEAGAALQAMQGGYIGGRPVRLDYSQPRPQNSDSPGRGRGGFGRGGGSGGFGGRGGGGRGRGGQRGGFGGRGGSRGGRGGSTNRGGFGDFSGRKVNFD